MLRLALVSLLGVTACTQVFGLDPPMLACDGDNFDDNQLDTDRWELYGAGQLVSERSQRLEIQIPLDAAALAGVQARDPLEVGDAAQVELAQPNQGPYSLAALAVVVDGDNGAYASKNEDTLRLAVMAGGTATDELMMPYQPALHRFWRIARAVDTVTFSTSGEGRSWKAHRTVQVAWGDILPTIFLYGGSAAFPTAGGTIAFDNFEVVTPSCSP